MFDVIIKSIYRNTSSIFNLLSISRYDSVMRLSLKWASNIIVIPFIHLIPLSYLNLIHFQVRICQVWHQPDHQRDPSSSASCCGSQAFVHDNNNNNCSVETGNMNSDFNFFHVMFFTLFRMVQKYLKVVFNLYSFFSLMGTITFFLLGIQLNDSLSAKLFRDIIA